jgi:hypothetical protein
MCPSKINSSKRSFSHQKSKSKPAKSNRWASSTFICLYGRWLKNLPAVRSHDAELVSLLLLSLLLLLQSLTQIPKAIFPATSLVNVLVLLTNYSSGTNPLLRTYGAAFVFLMTVRPPAFVILHRGAEAVKEAFCCSLRSLSKVMLVLHNFSEFKLLDYRQRNYQCCSLNHCYTWQYLKNFTITKLKFGS